MPTEILTATFHIKLDGSDASETLMNNLVRLEVDRSLFMPGQFILEFVDVELVWVDDTTLQIGKEVEILAGANPTNDPNAPAVVSLIKGEITAVEPVFDNDGVARVVVRGYDKLHRLQRGNRTATFLQMTDSDIISKVAREAGLSATVTATSTNHPYVIRDDISDYDFLTMLARRNGQVLHFDNGTLNVKAPDAFSFPEVTSKWLQDLLEFRPSLSISGQVNEVTVRGWDPKQKREVVGRATTAKYAPNQIGHPNRGFQTAQSKISTGKFHLSEVIDTQDMAQKVADSAFSRMAANDLVGEGLCEGEPKIKPGAKIRLTGLGTNFSGTYLVTRARHFYSPDESYRTEFWVGGMSSGTMANLLSPAKSNEPLRSGAFHGLIPAIVTNNSDPDDLGRVKVKFPSLSADDESFWARVVSLGAGADRGWNILPEVNDEVVVGFANGDPNRPYLLGGVWNGMDKMPSKKADTVVGGKVEIREFKTRVGHVLRFTDGESNAKIELLDKTGKNTLVIDTKENKISIEAGGDISVKAGKNVTIEGGMNVSVKAGMNLELKAVNVNVEASAKFALKAAVVDIAGSGPVKISGAMVMIN